MKVNLSSVKGGNIYDLTGMQVFKIVDVEENEEYKNINFTLVNKNGARKWEKFNVYDERGLRSFAGFVRAIVGSVDEVECKDLVGKFVKFECEPYTYTKDNTTKTIYQKKKGTWYESATEEEFNGKSVETIPTEPEEVDDVADTLASLGL